MVWGQYFYVIAEAIPLPPSMEMSIAVCHGPLAPLLSRLLRAELYDQPSSTVPSFYSS